MRNPLSLIIFVLSVTFFARISAAEEPHRTPHVGFLSPRAGPAEGENAFQQGLREVGLIDGENIVVEWRFTRGEATSLSRFAHELVKFQVDVIVVGGRQAALAAKNATQTIPIVIAAAGDPVAAGLAASLAHPGGNVTGLSIDAPGLNGKRLEFLRETLPKLSRAVVLYNSTVPGWNLNLKETDRSARLLKIRLHPVGVSSEDPSELQRVFSTVRHDRDEGFLKLPAAELPSYRKRIVELAAESGLPAIYDDKQITEAGGLMSYGTNVPDLYRRAASFVARMLKGARPSSLPIEQPTSFELVINLKTANALGLTIPPSMLARADRVIR
jgi:putative ABC transport system substrate-binding protein